MRKPPTALVLVDISSAMFTSTEALNPIRRIDPPRIIGLALLEPLTNAKLTVMRPVNNYIRRTRAIN